MTLSQRVDRAMERSDRLKYLHTCLRAYSDLALDLSAGRPGTVYVPMHVYSHMKYLQDMIEFEQPNRRHFGPRSGTGLQVIVPEGFITIKIGGDLSRWSAL
jgi:hypothetical protein